jgi:hypothetical protein
MREESYLVLRKFFFWLALIAFLGLAPVIIFSSLGYKFNWSSKKFLKTGAITIETTPKEASVFLDGQKMKETTPATFREVLPDKHTLVLEKDGYYPYELTLLLKPSRIAKVDVVLIPKARFIEKSRFDFDVYRFFVTRHIFGDKIIAFTDKGIFFVGTDLQNARQVCGIDIGPAVAGSVEGLKEYDNSLIYWNARNIWMLKIPEPPEEICSEPVLVYKAQEVVREVFLGIKDKYLIVHDGRNIVAQDASNPAASFIIKEIRYPKAEVFYDSRTEALYLRDRMPETGVFSIFKMELIPMIGERKENEEAS